MKFANKQLSKKYQNAITLVSEKKFTQAVNLLNQLKIALEASNDIQPLIAVDNVILKFKDMNIPPNNPNQVYQVKRRQSAPVSISVKTKRSNHMQSNNDEEYKPTRRTRTSKGK